MTQEEKDLLMKDLCSRLPYSVKIQDSSYQNPLKILSINPNGETWAIGDKGYPIDIDWEDCKPYLFPLSSMTKEQRKYIRDNHVFGATHELFDWLNKNHFDYRGLIEKGLAIDCTNLNIY